MFHSICRGCGSEFIPMEPGESICYLCTMQPDNVSTPIRGLYQVEGADHKVFPNLVGPKRKGALPAPETMGGLGMTGRRAVGAVHAANTKRRAYRYKQKTCLKCGKQFYPTGALRRFCDKCQPTKAERSAKIKAENKRRISRKVKEVNLTKSTFMKILSMSKQYGLIPDTLMAESLRYFKKYRLPVDAQILVERP